MMPSVGRGVSPCQEKSSDGYGTGPNLDSNESYSDAIRPIFNNEYGEVARKDVSNLDSHQDSRLANEQDDSLFSAKKF
jgi:hypothetical protein